MEFQCKACVGDNWWGSLSAFVCN